jgi:predicted ATP-dependent serine protease
MKQFQPKQVGELSKHDPRQSWLINDLWPTSGIGILAGSPKLGKSWFCLEMAVAVASGTAAFRHHQSEQGRVLYIPGEGKESRIRERIEQLSQNRSVDIDQLELFVLQEPGLRLDESESYQALRETVQSIQPTLIIIDPVRRFMSGDENSSGVVAQLLNSLTDINQETGAAILLVHHMSKKSRSDGSGLRGSSDFHAWGDCNLYLSKSRSQPDKAILRTEMRDSSADELRLFGITNPENGREVRPSLDLQLSEENPAKLHSKKQRIIESLRELAPCSKTQLRNQVSMNNVSFAKTLESLIEQGFVKANEESKLILSDEISSAEATHSDGSCTDSQITAFQ